MKGPCTMHATTDSHIDYATAQCHFSDEHVTASMSWYYLPIFENGFPPLLPCLTARFPICPILPRAPLGSGPSWCIDPTEAALGTKLTKSAKHLSTAHFFVLFSSDVMPAPLYVACLLVQAQYICTPCNEKFSNIASVVILMILLLQDRSLGQYFTSLVLFVTQEDNITYSPLQSYG